MLNENNTFISDVLDSLTSHIAVIDANGTIRLVNKSWRQFKLQNTGSYEFTNDIGINYLAVCSDSTVKNSDEYAEAALNGINAVLKGEQSRFEMEYPCHSPTEQRWFKMDVSALKEARSGAVVSHTIITDRKIAQEALTDLMQEQQLILENAPVGISKVIDRKQVLVNNKTVELFRYSKEEMEFQTTRKLYPSDEAYEKLGQEAYPVLAQGNTFETVQELIRKDGAHLLIRYVGKAVDSTDMSKGTIWLLEDITERKQVEEKLTNSEMRYRKLFEMESDSLLMLDSETGRFIDVNIAAQNKYGYSKDEFMQMRHVDISAEPSMTEQSLKNFETLVAMRLHRKKDGSTFPVDITGSYFEYLGRRVHVAAIRDITERLAAEEKVLTLNKRLQALNEHLQTVQEQERKTIARDFHDNIGQNIAILKLDLEWIERRITEDRSDLHERIMEMRASIEQLYSVVQRIITNLRPPLLDDIGIRAAIEWQVTEFRKHSGIKCSLLLSDDIEQIDIQKAEMLVYIIQEGLTNVIRHAAATVVSVSLCKTDGNLILELSDNGVGLVSDQIDSPTSFGLISMQERAKICKGIFQIKGSPGVGTTLLLEIPMRTGELEV
jgi:PAS domain S-box-containing protein